MRVIAINGRKRSGKDTITDYLVTNYDKTERVQFARLLKELFLSSFNKIHAQKTLMYEDIDGATDFDREEIIDNELMCPEDVFVDFIYNLSNLVNNKYNGLVEFDNIKAIIQANELIKEYKEFSVRQYLEFLGTEIAKVLDDRIWAKLTILETINKDVDLVVISDLRFEEEYWELRNNKDIELLTIKVERNDNKDTATHSSDIGLPNHLMDYIIKNDGSVVDLYNKIELILKEELK